VSWPIEIDHFSTDFHRSMRSATIRDVPKPALIRLVAQYLNKKNIIEPPVSLFRGSPGVDPTVLRQRWYFECASSIVYWTQTPMLKPKPASDEKSQLLQVIYALFEKQGWITEDPTGLILASKWCINKLNRIATRMVSRAADIERPVSTALVG
jgi:ribosomal protein S19E (S16A)